MIRAVRRKLEKANTHPILLELALDGIMLHIDDKLPEPDKYPDDYRMLVQAQNSIGWDNFLKGRLSKLWSHHQQHHLQTTDSITNKNNGTTWATNLATTLLDQWHRLWKVRNEERHGKDWAAQALARKDQITREVSLLYENATDVPQHLSDNIYTCDLETHLQKQPAELVAWLANWMPIYEDHIRKQRQQNATTSS